MKLEWMGEQRDLIEKIIHYGNGYAAGYKKKYPLTEELSLSPSEIQVVEYLLENEEKKLNMAQIARRLGISTSSFTVLVARLTRMGLLEKYHLGSNRKNVVVIVSDKGRSAYERYVQIMEQLWTEPVLNRLKQLPPESVAIISDVLDVLSGACSAQEEPPEPLLTPLDTPDSSDGH